MQGKYYTSSETYLKIGDYIINIEYNPTNLDFYYMPYSAEAFCFKQLEKDQSIDFKWKINLQDNYTLPKNKIYNGLGRDYKPLSIFKDNNDNISWVNKNLKDDINLLYFINKEWSNLEIIIDNTKTYGLDSFSNLSDIFSYSILPHDGIMLHGVIMEYNGKGIIVSASSGTGKTTHTRMWRDKKNALILNGDRALCRKKEGIWYTYGCPWSGSSGEYINRKVPIAAIVLLERGDENIVTEVSPFDGAKGIIPRVFAPLWDSNLINMALNTIDNIVSEIPILRLKCRPDLDAVEVLEKAIDRLEN